MCSALAEADDQANRGRGRVLEGVIFGIYAVGMVCKVVLAIEMGADTVDIFGTHA